MKYKIKEWSWGRAGGDCAIFDSRTCKNEIAKILPIEGDNTCEQMDANAKLMSAAPDLLNALTEALESFKKASEKLGIVPKNKQAAWVDKATDAIKRATI